MGAALFVWHHLLDKSRQNRGRDTQKASLLGPAYTTVEARAFLESVGARYRAFADERALHAEHPAVAAHPTSGGSELVAGEQMVEVGDSVSRDCYDQLRVLLVIRDGRVEGVVLGVVGALITSATGLSPEEARYIG